MTGIKRWLAALLIAAWLPSWSAASCLANPDPEILRLQQLIEEDASKALSQAQSLRASLQHAPARDAAASASRIAALYSVEAQAYGMLELDSEARASAAQGLLLASSGRDPVHIELLTASAESFYDPAGIETAIGAIEAARSLQPHGSPGETCLLISRGLLEHRLDREDLAIVTLMQAYHASMAPELATAHNISAEYLSLVMRSMGDYTQALSLNQEKIDWDTAHHATMSLSVSRFMRGQILKMMGNYSAAILEFAQARALSVLLADTQGIAFADQRICESHIELGQLGPAQRECANAYTLFSGAKAADSVKLTQLLQARIDLGLGHAERALATMNKVLDRSGSDLPVREAGSMYQWRARANAAMHNYRDAYEDLQEYVQRYTAANDAERIRQAGALRARFETDREVERNTTLERELRSSHEQSSRQAQQLRWNAVAAVAGVWIIALLIYFLIANRRYRQQLVALASQDSLTGLPNRRRTAEVATAAMQSAIDSQRPLTLAIIDLDHFKDINDRCGHAAGDYVLKEFARAGREALRSTDTLGRWGGEEFLLVMPETTVEAALGNLERLRTLLFAIRLPAAGSALRVSVSAGIASHDVSIRSLDELIARADSALYLAKQEGRDLVRVADLNYQTASTGVRRALRPRS
jgi:diguanylate cyclase (GGDEF)-like protein